MKRTKSLSLQYRQGDVFIERISALPDAVVAKPRDRGRVVLAYGEVTGHAHAIDASLAELFEARDGVLYLRVTGGDAALKHEEHATIDVAPGVYRVVHQREYSPSENRRVAD